MTGEDGSAELIALHKGRDALRWGSNPLCLLDEGPFPCLSVSSAAEGVLTKNDAAPIALDELPEGARVHLHAGPLGAYLGDVTGWANVAGGPTYDLVIADEDGGDPLTGGRTYVLFDMGGGVPQPHGDHPPPGT